MGKKKFEPTPEELEVARIRIPRQGEVLGVVEMMLGADKVRGKCDDGNTRICRIPGRLRKKVWVKIGDLILIQPWKVQSEERGDIIFRYTPTQANWLRRKGFVKTISIE
ncbi:MAG: translation initiation factor eIF-1A [Candidatus Aenigmarchaeota archaeon]|nr:translation initiation factor eIF-1A [Candidatus Aenigmarchaeota archaeon]